MLALSLVVPGVAAAQSPSVAPAPVGPPVWTQTAAGPRFEKDARMIGGTAFPDGRVVLVGSLGAPVFGPKAVKPVAAGWSSIDGVTWNDAGLAGPKGSVAHGVVPWGAGALAVGSGPDGGLVWISEDGATFGPPTVFDGAPFVDIAVLPDGRLLATGTTQVKRKRRTTFQPAAWTSVDGLAWEKVALDTAGTPLRVAVSSTGLMTVVGLGDGFRPVAWTSSDATTWTRSDVPAAATSGWVNDVAWIGDAFAAVMTGQDGSTFARSPDGLSWTTVLETDRQVGALGMGPGGPVALGTGATWSSVDGTTWMEALDPAFDGYAVGVLTSTPAGGLVAAGQTGNVTAAGEAAAWTAGAAQ
jgi:hypothetical protein